jgi:hypothetical protein
LLALHHQRSEEDPGDRRSRVPHRVDRSRSNHPGNHIDSTLGKFTTKQRGQYGLRRIAPRLGPERDLQATHVLPDKKQRGHDDMKAAASTRSFAQAGQRSADHERKPGNHVGEVLGQWIGGVHDPERDGADREYRDHPPLAHTRQTDRAQYKSVDQEQRKEAGVETDELNHRRGEIGHVPGMFDDRGDTRSARVHGTHGNSTGHHRDHHQGTKPS